MEKTRSEIEKLKKEWVEDPIWDLADTEGFEDYKEELEHFQSEMEKMWKEERAREEQEANDMAEKLGVVRLYKLIKKQEEIITKHERVLELLIDRKSLEAYRVFNGFWD